MSRTIIYPTAGAGLAAPQAAAPQPPTGFPEKLVKYVPGEVIAFYYPVYSAVGSNLLYQWIMFCLGLFGTIGYLYVFSNRTQPPRCYFYLLAAVAFIGWAVGTSSVGQDLLGLPNFVKDITVTITVFLVPLLDELAGRLSGRWPGLQRQCP